MAGLHDAPEVSPERAAQRARPVLPGCHEERRGPGGGVLEAASRPLMKGPKDHVKIRILQTTVPGIILVWALEPEHRILCLCGRWGH